MKFVSLNERAEKSQAPLSRMLPNNQYPIPQREPLIWVIRDRRI